MGPTRSSVRPSDGWKRREAEAGVRRPRFRSTFVLERKKVGSQSWPRAKGSLERGKEP